MTDYKLNEICSTVTSIVFDSLEVDEEASRECTLSTSLMNDLEAESLDFLDIIFRMEKAFGIKIERGKIEATLRARFPGQTVKPNSPVTPEMQAVLIELLPEIPSEEIRELKKIRDAARTFRIATFVRLSVQALLAKGARIETQTIDGYAPAQLGVANA